MRWSERPPVVRSRFPSLQPFRFDLRAFSVAVAPLVLVRPMKKPLVLASIAVLAVLIAGTGFAAFWIYSAARDVREYLPAQPRIAGVTIGTSTVRVGRSVACRSFRFSAASASSTADIARLFEPQLESEGWEKLASSGEDTVATSSWRHREKLNRGFYLVFAVTRLDGRAEYLASMTTAMYFPPP
jgi:hypothetical protein